MAIIEEIRRLRSEGWPAIAKIEGPVRIKSGSYRIGFLDVRGEAVGESLDIQADSDEDATEKVEAARKQMKR